jgi:flagellar motor switch protein FliN/FliY
MSSPELDFLTKELCDACSEVFLQNSGAAYALKAGEAPAAAAEGLGFILRFSGTVKGEIFTWMDAHSCAVLAAKLIGAEVEETAPLAEHEDAVSEIMNQSAGLMATSLRNRFGTAEIAIEKAQGPAPAAKESFTLRPAEGDDQVSITLYPDKALTDSVAAALAVPLAEPPQQAEVTTEHKGAGQEKNLELIMDVELDLTLRFGKRTMILSEVADLTTGSVIELDRVVDEPVELLLGDRVIARGDVVIVDGNYGLRVTELASVEHGYLTA